MKCDTNPINMKERYHGGRNLSERTERFIRARNHRRFVSFQSVGINVRRERDSNTGIPTISSISHAHTHSERLNTRKKKKK